MNSLEIGDLVHVPAAVPLVQFNERTTQVVERRVTTRAPAVGLVMSSEQKNGYREIYWRGEKWAASERSLYKIKENIK